MRIAGFILMLLAVGCAALAIALPRLAEAGAQRGDEQMLEAYQAMVDEGVVVEYADARDTIRDRLVPDTPSSSYPMPLIWIFGILAAALLWCGIRLCAGARLPAERFRRFRRHMIWVLAAKMLLVFPVLLFLPVVFKADRAGRYSQISQAYANLLDASMITEAADVGEWELHLQLFNAATNDRHTVVETVTAASLIMVLFLLIAVCGCVVLSPQFRDAHQSDLPSQSPDWPS